MGIGDTVDGDIIVAFAEQGGLMKKKHDTFVASAIERELKKTSGLCKHQDLKETKQAAGKLVGCIA